MTGRDHLSKGEIAKDAVQAGAEAAAHAVGEVATILTRAVGDVAAAVGGLATEMFEIRDSSRRALAEHAEVTGPGAGDAALDAEAVDAVDAIDPADPAGPAELVDPAAPVDTADPEVQG